MKPVDYVELRRCICIGGHRARRSTHLCPPGRRHRG
jgi:hypothetical protein